MESVADFFVEKEGDMFILITTPSSVTIHKWLLNPTQAMQTTTQYYRMDRREIAYFKFIIEAYDGIAVVSTLDPLAGIVKLSIAPGCEADVVKVIEDLKKEVMIETVRTVNI